MVQIEQKIKTEFEEKIASFKPTDTSALTKELKASEVTKEVLKRWFGQIRFNPCF